jgi:hypothetical protein
MSKVRLTAQRLLGLFSEGFMSIRDGSLFIISIWQGIITVTKGIFKVLGSLVCNAALLLSFIFMELFIIAIAILIMEPLKLYGYLNGSNSPRLRRSISVNNVPSL